MNQLIGQSIDQSIDRWMDDSDEIYITETTTPKQCNYPSVTLNEDLEIFFLFLLSFNDLTQYHHHFLPPLVLPSPSPRVVFLKSSVAPRSFTLGISTRRVATAPRARRTVGTS